MTRFWPLATIVGGVSTLVLLIGFTQLPDVRAAYPGGDFAPAMSAFQRAETPADLGNLFGAPPDPARVRAMTAANSLDLYAFVPAYGLFLIAGAAMLAGGVRKPLAWLAIVPALVGLGADIAETAKQLEITADLDRAAALLPVAPLAWLKYFALALSALGASAIAFLGVRKRWLLGALGCVPIVATIAEYTGAVHIPSLMTLGLAVFWTPLLATAAIQALKPSI